MAYWASLVDTEEKSWKPPWLEEGYKESEDAGCVTAEIVHCVQLGKAPLSYFENYDLILIQWLL